MARPGSAPAPAATANRRWTAEDDRLAELIKQCVSARSTYPEGHRERVEINRQIERLRNV